MTASFLGNSEVSNSKCGAVFASNVGLAFNPLSELDFRIPRVPSFNFIPILRLPNSATQIVGMDPSPNPEVSCCPL